MHVFEKFPFHKYKFSLLTVERPGILRCVLEKHVYVYVKDNGWFRDELYVLKSFPTFEKVMLEYGKLSKTCLVTITCPVTQFPWTRHCFNRTSDIGKQLVVKC